MPFGICLGPAETRLSLARCRRRVAGCQASPEPRARVRPISISTHPVRRLRQPRRRRRSRGAGVRRRTDLRSSCSRWRMSSSIKYEFMDVVLTIGHLPAGYRRGRGRAPWPGRWPGPAGRAEGPHAQGVGARTAGYGYGFVYCLSSPQPVLYEPASASLCSSSGRVPRGTACVSAPGMGVTRKCAGESFPFRPVYRS